MQNITPLSSSLMLKLIDREVNYYKQIVDVISTRKVAIFTAGPTGSAFDRELYHDLGIYAEFFIDNNPALEGQIINDKPVLHNPWEKYSNFAEQYAIITASSPTINLQIERQLSNICRVPCISHYQFNVFRHWEQIKSINELLEDEFSKVSYLASIYYLLSCDNSFIQFNHSQYFAVKEFARPLNEIIVDAGAFTGDTVEEYVKRSFGCAKIYAFEPYEVAITALRARVSRLKTEWALSDDSITIVPAGVGYRTEQMKGSLNHLGFFTENSNGHIDIQVRSLDEYFSDKEPPTLLKADVEGMEQDMLKGAENLIKCFKPKISVCIYHRFSDYIAIPRFLRNLVPEYRFAVRNHSIDWDDTVLYCWTEACV